MGSTPPESLIAARGAFARHAYEEACAQYAAADGESALEPADLAAYAWANWFRGRMGDFGNLLERGFAAHMEAGNPCKAAVVALDLMRYHGAQRGGVSMAMGWLKKAERLLEDQPDCAERGRLRIAQAFLAQREGKLDRSLALAEEALALGQQHGDPDVLALALNRKGRILIKKGNVEEGRSALDEAMVGAVGGELSALVTGIVYCSTIDGCADLSDYGRASEWTEAAKRWCERNAINGFPGICRVHRAEIMRLKGSWAEAEREVRLANRELEAHAMDHIASAGYAELGEIRMRLGDLDGADEAFRQADEMGHVPEPGQSLLKLARGKAAAAAASIRRVLEDREDRLARTRLLPAAIEIFVEARDIDRARACTEELEASAEVFGSPALVAGAQAGRGCLHLIDEDPGAAIKSLRKAIEIYKELELPFEGAKTRLILSRAYRTEGDTDAAEDAAERARDAFARLGATTEAERAAEELSEGKAQREAATFMFTDIVGSTSLLEAMGDDAWSKLLHWHDEMLRICFQKHRGREVKHTGDGFHVAFIDAATAIACAMNIQQRLEEHRRSQGFAPEIRIGLHATEALRTGSDYAGKGVHEAARIGALAAAGEILVSWDTLQQAGSNVPVVGPRAVSLKGISEPVEVGTVQWQQAD